MSDNDLEFAEFYAKIYNLAYITRYSGVPRIKNESVAEHSFFVASLVIKLHEIYDFDLGTALQMAITHDWAESFIGDITWRVKKQNPDLEKAVTLAEHVTMGFNFNSDICSVWSEYMAQASVEAKIVLMADIIQVAQYAENEVKLGNTGYMIDVANSAYNRLEQLKEQLNEFKRQ